MSKGVRAMPGQTDHGEALRQASRVNDMEKLKELLDNGAEVNASYVRTSSQKRPVLHHP